MKLTAWPIAFNAQESADLGRMRLGPAGHDDSRIDFVVLVDSAEAFDKGHADCNPNDDTLLHFECFRSKRAEKSLDSLDWHNASSGYGINAH
jgi:hypothetical protein